MTLLMIFLIALFLVFTAKVGLMFTKHPQKAWKMLKFALGGPMILLMNDFGSSVSRSDAEALIPEEVSREIIQNVPQQSAVMRLARRLPNMSRRQQTMPILSALATAYFVNGDTGLKQTTKQAWDKKNIVAEELAVIVPIPEAVLDDSDYDIWGEVRPRIAEAFGIAYDQAVFYSTNKPASWPNGLLAGATAAGNVVALGTNDDLYDDILGENGTLAKVELDGYNVTGHVGALTMKSRLRGLRDADGRPLFNSNMQDAARYMLDGNEIVFPLNGAVDAAQSLLISGDWTQLVYAMRQDITYKILTEAVIQDAEGTIIYNLAQQDMIALRAVMRLGWQLPNPINRINTNSATRYPFTILKPAA
jgi:Predicted phage phi-C31 gp36 major capsid-like protein